jgi:hypothetical protein
MPARRLPGQASAGVGKEHIAHESYASALPDPAPAEASIAADLLINPVYMGDYDGVAADATGRSEGFLGAYGDNSRGNPDVVIAALD